MSIANEPREPRPSTKSAGPVKLPLGHFACEACGIAVASPPTAAVMPLCPTENSRTTARPVEFSRCANCQGIHEAADAYIQDHPFLVGRLGNEIARERVEGVLQALELLDQAAPTDLSLLLPHLPHAARGVRFAHPLVMKRDMCNPYPWAHVTHAQRADLRTAYAATLRDRLALSAPPVTLDCPSGGCLFCGLASVQQAAIEVARAGGAKVATRFAWTRLLAAPVSLGGVGPNYIEGHTCPDCTHAIEAKGAVGWPARAQAVLEFVALSSTAKGERLRRRIEGDFPPTLRGWGALSLPPSESPWAHVGPEIDLF